VETDNFCRKSLFIFFVPLSLWSYSSDVMYSKTAVTILHRLEIIRRHVIGL